MTNIQEALQPLIRGRIAIQGTSDLTLAGTKFGGSSQRRKRGYLLFHGVFLLQMDLGLIENHLPLPSKQPGYRENRAHKDFLMNIELPAAVVKQALRRGWCAQKNYWSIPRARVEWLVENQYATQEWIHRF